MGKSVIIVRANSQSTEESFSSLTTTAFRLVLHARRVLAACFRLQCPSAATHAVCHLRADPSADGGSVHPEFGGRC